MNTWDEIMERASKKNKNKQKPYFSEEDIELSILWRTSPVSEYFGKIEFWENDLNKGPKDIYLVLDSIYFTKGLEDDNYDLAFFCYKGIKDQLAAILAGKDRMTMLRKFLGISTS